MEAVEIAAHGRRRPASIAIVTYKYSNCPPMAWEPATVSQRPGLRNSRAKNANADEQGRPGVFSFEKWRH